MIILSTPLWFNIEITTEKTTTKPPIVKIEEIEFVIDFPSNSPRLQSEIVEFDEFESEPLVKVKLTWRLLKRKKIPPVTHANIWVINNNMPILVLPNNAIPTVQ